MLNFDAWQPHSILVKFESLLIFFIYSIEHNNKIAKFAYLEGQKSKFVILFCQFISRSLLLIKSFKITWGYHVS